MGVPLTVRGRRQARGAADTLMRAGVRAPVRLLSSDQARAAETASVIAARLEIDVEFSPLLREQALGCLEGRLTRELHPQPVPEGRDVSEVAWGGGETIEHVWRRAALFTETHLVDHPGDVVVVSHGTLIQVFLSHLDGRGHRDVDWDVVVPNGAVITRPVPRAVPTRH